MPKAKKHRPIVGFKTKPVHSDIAAHQQPTKRHKKQSQPQSAAAGPPQVQKAVNKNWRCSSIIDQQASEAVGRLLHAAATKSSGATIKSLTLAPHIVHKKPTFAVTCETLKHLPLLQPLVQQVQLVQEHAPQLTEAAAYVLAYELLFGQGCRQHGPAEKAVASSKAAMQAHLRELHQEHGTKGDTAALLQRLRTGGADGSTAAGTTTAGGALFAADGSPLQHPRTARVNLIKSSVEEVLQVLRQAGAAAGAGSKAAALADAVQVDSLLPDLLVWPPGTDLHDHPLVASGQLILQSKASCMPAHALAPEPGWTVVDCCAAPGNKTTHVAALLAAHSSSNSSADDSHPTAGAAFARKGSSGRPGSGQRGQCGQSSTRSKVLAFDKDPKRLKRLQGNVERAGAAGIIQARCADFLSLDPLAPEFAQVQGVVLDPSCSGSGTGVSRLDHLLPSTAPAAAAPAPAAAAAAEAHRGPHSASGKQQAAGKKRKQAQLQPDTAEGRSSAAVAEAGAGAAGACSSGSASQAGPGAVPLDEETQKRVEQLAKFQEAALRHALKFPALQRLVYSTCSVYRRENEDVVASVLPAAAAAGFALVDPFPNWHRRGLHGTVEHAEKLVRTDAAEDGTDGFFVAVFARQG